MMMKKPPKSQEPAKHATGYTSLETPTYILRKMLGHRNCSSNIKIHQSPNAVYKQDGESVTLDYSFPSSSNYYVMYRQPPSGEMIYVIHLYSQDKNSRKGRYSVMFRKEDKTLKLTISALTPRDSAVYLCAGLDSTVRVVTGRTLQKPQDSVQGSHLL
ncbi:T cell receptor alpha variable 19 [Rhinolophus ferrumequinum]|nr:T cell receptor alpha variable 19 [Rhinolophus ferrumequinum]